LRFAFAILLLGVCSAASAEGNVNTGKDLYSVCAGCHGFEGEGNRTVNAPRLAGMPGWYLVRQLRHFQDGVRGGSEDDLYGAQMARMALSLWDLRAIQDVVAYIGTLPAAPAEPTVRGNPARGKERYQPCAACHGAQAEGLENVSAPKLAGLDDWYIVKQLELFKAGLRGTHPDDTYGAQMRPFVTVLADPQSLLDVAAYINTLQSLRDDARRRRGRD
jgi:cytochrome c oxidase subunit 2